MASRTRRGRRTFFVFTVLVIFNSLPNFAFAHVQLDAPNGGETLDAGSIFTIEWNPPFTHTTLNWDLWYSTTGAEGPWNVIALDLPLGANTPGSPHYYDWQVPNVSTQTARVRVRQDNLGDDYFDVSDGDFTIVAAPGTEGDYNANGHVGASDYTVWQDHLGAATVLPNETVTPGQVTAEDYDAWKENYGATWNLNLGASLAVPEPPSAWLLLVALVGYWICSVTTPEWPNVER